MFLGGLSITVGAIFGLIGKTRLFGVIFGSVTAVFAGLAVFDYFFYVVPNMEKGGSDDGTRIGFAFALAFVGAVWLATFFAFCIGGFINAFLRWMDWL